MCKFEKSRENHTILFQCGLLLPLYFYYEVLSKLQNSLKTTIPKYPILQDTLNETKFVPQKRELQKLEINLQSRARVLELELESKIKTQIGLL